MDQNLLIKYLKFLDESANLLKAKDTIERFDIAALQQELANFKRQLAAQTSRRSAITDSIAVLELKVRESDLGGDVSGVGRMLLRLFLRGRIIDELERRQQSGVKEKIQLFRDEVGRILFSVVHGRVL